MFNRTTVNDKLASMIRTGFMPIFVDDNFDPRFLAEICGEAGIPAVEYSLRRKDIRQMLPELKKHTPEVAILAASTVDDEKVVKFLSGGRDFPSLKELYDIGADGAVSMLPFRKETYDTFGKNWLLIPGVETAGEAFQQLVWGAHMVKLFNTESFGGPKRVKTMCGPTHNIFPLLLTGGMYLEKLESYVASGALVLTAGFDVILSDKYHQMQEKPDRNFIRECLEKYINGVAEARKKSGMDHWSRIKEPEKLFKETGRFFTALEAAE